MRLSLRKVLGAAVVVASASLVVPTVLATSASASGPNIYGLDTANEIVSLTSDLHNNANTIVARHAITGLVNADVPVALDRNPGDGLIWLVTTNPSQGHLYTVDPTTGVATLKAGMDFLGFFDAPYTLSGSQFGATAVSFTGFGNGIPSMEIISDTGQAEIVTLTATDVGSGFVVNPGVVLPMSNTSITGLLAEGTASDGTVFGVTQRKLYTIDQNTSAATFVAPLQSFSTSSSGLDIDSGTAYYSRGNAGTNSSIYTLDLTTGNTTRILTTPNGTVLREITL